MDRFFDWLKKYKWQLVFCVLGVAVVLAIIACIILGCLSDDLLDVDHKSLWMSFLCAVTGAGASLLIGLIAFYQNKRMKQLSDAKDALTREENEKQRQQDLRIRTNPKVNFENVDNIVYVGVTGVFISDKERVNRLTEETFDGMASFGKELNMNLIFDANDNVDYLRVEELTMSQVDEDLWPMRKQSFINPSKVNSGQLKAAGRNKVKLFLQLLWEKLDERGDVEDNVDHALNNLAYRDTVWMVTMSYTAGNYLSGATNKYSTQFYFKNLSGDKNDYNFLKEAPDDKPLDIEMIEDKTTTWIIKEETQNGQAEDDVDGQGE